MDIPGKSRRAGTMVLAKVTLGALLIALAISSIEALALGAITSPVLALDVIAAVLVPFALLSVAAALTRRRSAPPAEEEGDEGGGGGGGSPPRDVQPLLPTGGIRIDWQRFESEFAAYVHDHSLVTHR